jgi:hypothetical protein
MKSKTGNGETRTITVRLIPERMADVVSAKHVLAHEKQCHVKFITRTEAIERLITEGLAAMTKKTRK